MNKFLTALVFLLSMSGSIIAQVGIGTTTPEASAALDVSSTDKGFLMPRMSTLQREAIVSPVDALLVFDTDTKSQWTFIDGVWAESKAGVGKFIDGGAADIAYYPDRVGIGRNVFSSGHKFYVESIKDEDRTHAAAVIRSYYDGAGTAPTTYGLTAEAINNSTGMIDYGIGLQGILMNPNAGSTVNIGVGSWPQVSNYGNINWSSAIVGDLTNNAGGTMGTASAENLVIRNESSAIIGESYLSSMSMENSGTISGDAYGLWIGGESTGTVGGNTYALYVDTPFENAGRDNITGNAYAIYSNNLNDSYFNGNVGIGTETPLQKVHIDGVMRLEPQDSEPAGDMGDFYVKSDGALYYHNGTNWVEIVPAP